MHESPPSSPAEKLRIAMELCESGIEVMRENLRRRHPGESEPEIQARLVAWLRTRPGAEHGDAPGRLRDPAQPPA